MIEGEIEPRGDRGAWYQRIGLLFEVLVEGIFMDFLNIGHHFSCKTPVSTLPRKPFDLPPLFDRQRIDLSGNSHRFPRVYR